MSRFNVMPRAYRRQLQQQAALILAAGLLHVLARWGAQ